jgi:hypothetical protein
MTILEKSETAKNYYENYSSTILYRALAVSEQQVKELADKAGIDLTGLTIELDRENVRDELGRSYEPRIEDAQVC